ncbi:MAG: hydroxyacid dehydrogenase, partial [Phycisphaerae bacterium]|nr:hydroxyacid dehydrogenase [Phycisphaerae bacterium]
MADIVHPSSNGEFLLYQTADGQTRIQCRFQGETIWLTQQQM